jgi:hypothetical protein
MACGHVWTGRVRVGHGAAGHCRRQGRALVRTGQSYRRAHHRRRPAAPPARPLHQAVRNQHTRVACALHDTAHDTTRSHPSTLHTQAAGGDLPQDRAVAGLQPPASARRCIARADSWAPAHLLRRPPPATARPPPAGPSRRSSLSSPGDSRFRLTTRTRARTHNRRRLQKGSRPCSRRRGLSHGRKRA